MKKKLLMVMSAFLLTANATQAIPAKRVTRDVVLADGSTVTLTLHGDEHYSYYTDAEGRPCQLSGGRLLMLTPQQVTDTWTARKRAFTEACEKSMSSLSARRRSVGTPSTVTTGRQRGLAILIQFADTKFVTPNAQQEFQQFFNTVGYSKYGNTGSVRDYFTAQSYGKLDIEFDVVGPYTTEHNMRYYGGEVRDDSGNLRTHDVRPALMVAEAVDAASKDVDFSNYDWDRDGIVDQVFVIYAGYAEAQGADVSTVWPHESQLAHSDLTRTYNGVTINTYGCSSELQGDGKRDTGVMDGIGTACHEFSHCLGLPDMYDTSEGNTNYAMGPWDVMCSGSYNNNSRTPAGYTSYERWFSRWMEPQEISSMTRVSGMRPLADAPEAYVLYNEANRNEFYLLENRQPVGFDAGLYGHGLLVVHVDFDQASWTANKLNTVEGRQRMTIIPADGTYDDYSNASLAGDPWPGVKGNTMLTDYTTPAAVLYNANVDGRKLMSKAIDNITEDNDSRLMSFVACRPELAAPSVSEMTAQAGSDSYTLSWPAVSGAVGYELELTASDKAAETAQEALTWQVNFERFNSSSTGFSDQSSKLGSYGFGGWSGEKLFTSPSQLKIGTSSATGFIRTPQLRMPASGEVTVVVGGAPVGTAASVKGSVEVNYANAGESWLTVSQDFELTGSDSVAVPFANLRKDYYRVAVRPAAQMYLNYLALYDGIWTAGQMGLTTASAPVMRRATEMTSHTAETNSYTFTGLSTAKRYAFRIRSLGEEGTYSQWSEEGTFDLANASGVDAPRAVSAAPVRYFDLQGRSVVRQGRGLLLRRQGGEVRKVMVR